MNTSRLSCLKLRSCRTVAVAWVLLLAPAAFADNNGPTAELTIHVTGCQGHPLEGVRVLLVGEQLGQELGGGRYRLKDVTPDVHRLMVYGDCGDVYDDAYVPAVISSAADLDVMLCLCINTRLTRVVGTVRDENGVPVERADVAISDLFLSATTDTKGRYELKLPPGTWEITARPVYTEMEGSASITLEKPGDEVEEMPIVGLDIKVE
jgi:hypothetical protein